MLWRFLSLVLGLKLLSQSKIRQWYFKACLIWEIFFVFTFNSKNVTLFSFYFSFSKVRVEHNENIFFFCLRYFLYKLKIESKTAFSQTRGPLVFPNNFFKWQCFPWYIHLDYQWVLLSFNQSVQRKGWSGCCWGSAFDGWSWLASCCQGYCCFC